MVGLYYLNSGRETQNFLDCIDCYLLGLVLISASKEASKKEKIDL